MRGIMLWEMMGWIQFRCDGWERVGGAGLMKRWAVWCVCISYVSESGHAVVLKTCKEKTVRERANGATWMSDEGVLRDGRPDGRG